MQKYFYMSAILFALFFSGCGDGGSSSTTPEAVVNTPPTQAADGVVTVSGVAQLGYISGGDVKLFELSNLNTPIATTKSATSSVESEAGRFSFEKVALDAQKYYLLQISGGKDIDPNDDGETLPDEAVDINGSVYTLAKGDDLLDGKVRINVLSDIAYQKLKASLSTLKSSDIDAALDANAKEYLYDIDGDGEIGHKDILAFNPILHTSKTKQSYKDILDIYVPNLHSGGSDEAKLSSLMYLDTPKIVIKNGNLQEVPFTLQMTVENMPAGLDIVWSINAEENASMNIQNDETYEIIAKLTQGNNVLKTLTSTVVATSKTTLATMDVNATQDSIVYVSDETNTSLSGIQVVVPKNALAQNTQLSVKKSSMNTLPQTDGTAISDVLILEPAGLTFAKPVQVSMPYYGDANLIDQNVRIARYSENGVVDYITPLSVNTQTHEIVFETEHFTAFQLQTNWIGQEKPKASQTEITAIEALTGLKYTNVVWEKILNKKVADKATVYDLYLEYRKNSAIVEKLNSQDYVSAYKLFLSSTKDAEDTSVTLENIGKLYDFAIDTKQMVGDVKDGLNTLFITKKYYAQIASNIGMVTDMNPMSFVTDYTTYVFKQGLKALSLADNISKNNQLNAFFQTRKTQSFSFILSKLKKSYNEQDMIEVADGVYASNGLFSPTLYTDGVLKYQDLEAFWYSANLMYEMAENFKTQTDFNYASYNAEHVGTLKNIIEEHKKLVDNGGEYIDITYFYVGNPNSITVGDTVSLDVSCEVDASSAYALEFKVYEPSAAYADKQLSGVSITKTSAGHYRLTFNTSNAGRYYYYVNATAKLSAKALSDSQNSLQDSFLVNEKTVNEPQKANTAPIAYAGTNKNVQTNSLVKLSSALGYDTESNALSYGWSMIKPSGSKAIFSNTSVAQPSFTPDVAGKYILALIVYDGKLKSSASMVTVTATAPEVANTAPSASAQNKTLKENSTNTAITLSASDADEDTLTYSLVAQPSHGTLSGTAPNLKYTPSSGYSGTDSFTFKVNDGKVDSNTAIVSITVERLLYKQIAFVSESAPLDNSVVQRGSTFTKSWTVKNSGSLDLTNVRVVALSSSSALVSSITQNISSSLVENAQTSYILTIDVPSSAAEGTYEASFKLVDGSGDLKYADGNTAIFYYKFVVEKPNDFQAFAYLSATTYKTNESALLGIVINDGNAPYTATINWGDGTTETKQIATASNAINTSHSYTTKGKYSVSVGVLDAMGQTASISNAIEIIDTVSSITKWIVTASDKIANTNAQDITVNKTSQANGYPAYGTSWFPQTVSADYWLSYKLPVPEGVLKMNKKLRLTLVSTAGNLSDHNRELKYSLSDGKSYAYNIMSNINNGSGFIRIKDFQGTDTNYAVASLTDSAAGVAVNARAYAIESLYNSSNTSNYAILSAYKYENSAYSLLSSSAKSVDASTTLKELAISFKGNGISYLITLEYDKDGDGSYSSTEKIILNTETMEVDWSVFLDTTQNNSSTVKKTGQTKSYNTDGIEVTDGSVKDDGYYKSGETPRYTRASDMVSDELTGLMWQDDAAAASTSRPWLTSDNYITCANDTSSATCNDTGGDTAASYCSNLVLGGYTDWRLPTSTELEGIMDYGKVVRAIDTTYFNNVSQWYYWSSTICEYNNKLYAWIVDFHGGGVYDNSKGNHNSVRCVRAGQ